LSDSYLGATNPCIGEGWFIVGFVEKVTGDDSPIKLSTWCSCIVGSGGPSQIGCVDQFLLPHHWHQQENLEWSLNQHVVVLEVVKAYHLSMESHAQLDLLYYQQFYYEFLS